MDVELKIEVNRECGEMCQRIIQYLRENENIDTLVDFAVMVSENNTLNYLEMKKTIFDFFMIRSIQGINSRVELSEKEKQEEIDKCLDIYIAISFHKKKGAD